MEETGVETLEAEQPQVEIVDILSGKYKFHKANFGKLPRILSRGIYSPEFAKRIKDEKYKDRSGFNFRSVFLTSNPEELWAGDPKIEVGIMVDVSQEGVVPLRIAPHQFVGLVLADEKLSEDFLLRRIEQIKQVFEKEETKTRLLPIYGTSGDLIWPKRMSHEEIVRMLRERQKVQE